MRLPFRLTLGWLLLLAPALHAATPALIRDVNQYPAAPFLPPTAVLTNGHLFFPYTRADIGRELGIVDATTGAFQLIDINPGPDSSDPTDLARFGNTVIFAATTAAHGTEVWLSDGTAPGTGELLDLVADAGSSFPHGFVDGGQGLAYFSATDGVSGEELWSTDGTAVGTSLIELRAGSLGSSPTDLTPIPGARLIFAARATGIEPWLLPTAGNAAVIQDIRSGAGSSQPSEFTYLPARTETVFAADATGNNRELWITDSVNGGAAQVAEIEPSGSSNPRELRLINGGVVFRASTAVNGTELWFSNGSGTALIADTYPGTRAGVLETDGVALGATRYVFPAIFPDAGIEPAITDGAAITRLIDALPGAGAGWISQDEVTRTSAVSTSTLTYVGLDDGVHGWELWRTDGTPAGTALAVDLLPGLASSQARPIAVDGETVFFLAYDTTTFGLWRYANGSATRLSDLGQAGTAGAGIVSLATVGNQVFFNALDAEGGNEVWRTDGTAAGTTRVADTFPGFAGSQPQQFISTGSRLFFAGTDLQHGAELFSWDATSNVITLVKDILPGDEGSSPFNVTAFGTRVLFTATTPATGREPWISDGTDAGTTLLKDIAPDATDSFAEEFVVSGPRLFFKANGANGPALFVTDGTPDGTVELLQSNSVGELVPFGNGGVLSSLDTIDTGTELWVSDGTPQGTHLFTNLVAGADSSFPADLTVAGSRVFFTAITPEAGRELWLTDSTSAEATAVADLTSGPGDTTFVERVALGNNLIFVADTGAGNVLCVSDGTPAGTHPIDGICPSGVQCHPQKLFAFDGVVFFAFDDGVHGQELWQTDGTTAGTVMVADVVPGAGSFDFQRGAVAFLGGKIVFAGCDAGHGCEPWLLDYDQCIDDPSKLAPGACGCSVADTDADASGVADCLIPDELRARIDALTALIDPLTRPKSKAERAALKATLKTIGTALDGLLSYYGAHTADFPTLAKPIKKTKKIVRRLTHAGRAVKGPRRKALQQLTTLRGAIT